MYIILVGNFMNFYEFSKILEESKVFRIPSKDPVRKAIMSIPTYWTKPGMALTQIQDILFRHGYVLPHASFSVHDKTQTHTQNFSVERRLNPEDPQSLTEPTNSSIRFDWHWMPSGEQVEVVAYLT